MLFSAESLSIFNSLYCELQHTGKFVENEERGYMEFKVKGKREKPG